MDAGARGRRLLQRREYRAKVSEFIPKELEDQFSYDKNGQLVFELDLKKAAQRVKTGLKNWWNKPVINNPTKNQHLDKIRNQGGDPSHWANSFEPEGEMIEANSAQMKAKGLDGKACWKGYKLAGTKKKGGKTVDNCVKAGFEPEGEMIEANSAQMKAMYDAQMKKKEDDKVASKKKIKEGTKYGLYKGSGKASGAFKDYLDKKKKEKETKKEEVQLEAKVDKLLSTKKVRERRNKAAGLKDKKFNSLSKDQVSKQHQEFRRDYIHSEKRGVKKVKGEMTLKDRMGKMRGVNWRKKFGIKKEEVQLEAKKSCVEIDEKKKLFNTAPLSTRVSNWSKNIKEASPLTPDRNAVGLPKDLKSIEKKTKKSYTGRMYTGGDGTASRVEQVVQEMPDDLKNVGLNALKNAAGQFSKTGKVNVKNVLRTAANKALETDSVTKFLNKNSYEPQGEMIEKARKGKGAINPDVLKSNPNLDPLKPGDYIKLKRLSAKIDKASYQPQGEMIERKMTSCEKDKKEKYVKGMKKVKGDFTKRYGKDGKSVMYATATKMAMKKEGYGDVPFRDGRVKKYLGKDNISKIKLTNKGKQALRNIPDPKIFSGNKAINPDNAITNLYRTRDRLSMSSYEPQGEMIEDFYRKKYTVKDGYKKTNKMTKSNKRSGDSKAQYRELHKDLAKYKIKKLATDSKKK